MACKLAFHRKNKKSNELKFTSNIMDGILLRSNNSDDSDHHKINKA